jgi:hypothetical protein
MVILSKGFYQAVDIAKSLSKNHEPLGLSQSPGKPWGWKALGTHTSSL